jgi:hypothetical protein
VDGVTKYGPVDGDPIVDKEEIPYPVSGFLIPGLPGTSSLLPFGAFGSNSSLWPGLISSPP